MDGMHDVGGKQGFGPVKVTGDEEPAYAAEWEARMFAIVRAMTRDASWNLDKFRYTREQLPPLEYLSTPYFDQWYRCYAAMLVGSGWATPSELASGRSAAPIADVPAPVAAARVPEVFRVDARFDRPATTEPAFAPGAKVRVRLDANPGHTRMPQYIRGRPGSVLAHRGNHMLPDANAAGDPRAEHLYTVTFRIADLFPERHGSDDVVHVDLWESYVEPI